MKKNAATTLFYTSIGIFSSFLLFLIFYWHFRQTTNLAKLLSHTYELPYFAPVYIVLTILIGALFGINMALLVYRWRTYGSPFRLKDSGNGVGAVLGILASSCPVCGTTILSTIGVVGGLSSLPLQGLELKAVAVVLMAASLYLMLRDLRRMKCHTDTCPTHRDHTIKPHEHVYVWATSISALVILSVNIGIIQSDPVFATSPQPHELYDLSCSQSE